MEGNLILSGVKQFKGTVEGLAFDHTKLVISLPFPKSKSASNIGYETTECVYGLSDNFKKFQHIQKFPVIIECEYEVTNKGLEIYEAKVLQPNQPTK